MVRIREEIAQWQNSVSTMTEEMATLRSQLAEVQARPQSDPDKIAALEASLAETQAQLAEARGTLTALQAAPAPKSGEESHSPATPPVTSLETVATPPQTRATKRGWI